ncbi:MAG: hypothetical protein IIY70_00175, partial [Oscillospiraceae bacterium]|nr:hypothetical protein [Oscillospiraceae bacterium]
SLLVDLINSLALFSTAIPPHIKSLLNRFGYHASAIVIDQLDKLIDRFLVFSPKKTVYQQIIIRCIKSQGFLLRIGHIYLSIDSDWMKESYHQ